MNNSTREQTKNNIVKVSLNKTEIGTIVLLPDDRTLFAFSASYITDERRPTLSLSFKTPLGELRTEEKMQSQARLPPFFSNLLPEGYLRDYFAKKLRISVSRDFPLISALGADLPGAVRVEPVQPIRDDFAGENKGRSGENILRFSLAGVQPKFSVKVGSAGNPEIPPDGAGGNWIVKLPAPRMDQVPEAEYSMLSLAKHIGLDVPEFKLVSTAKIQGLPDNIERSKEDSLLIKRFDRGDNNSRIHMEDFAQVFGVYPDSKYEQASFDRIGYVILTESGEQDFLEYIRRLVLTVLTGNGDMHLKNWSLLYKDNYKPSLSPAYDLVPTILYLPKDNLALKLGGTKSFTELTEINFARLANRAKASESLVLNEVRKTTEKIMASWKIIRSDLPLSEDAKNRIELHMRSTHIIK